MCGSKRVWVSELIFILLAVKGWWSEGCLDQERSALLQLKHFFNDDQCLQNWVDDENYSDCCQWEGVECNDTTGRVIELDLAVTRKWESAEWYMNASLFTPFQQLESLDIMGNNIASCVKNEGLERLSRLNNLKFLHLDNNYFNNSIFSSLGGLSSLRRLSLVGNRLNGSIDIKGLDSLSNLEMLDMSDNAIDNLVVPKGLERLSTLNNLKFLDLGFNHFNNSIFSSLGGLSSLRQLSLAANRLNGSIDIKGLNSLSNLEELDMSANAIDNLVVPKGFNHFNNNIFSSLGGLSSLRQLSLAANRLNGSIDIKGLNSLSNLEELDMSANAIDNLVVPKDLRGLRKLNTLRLGGTDIATIDGSKALQSIGSLPSLKTLYLSYTNFTGIVVNQELHHFTNLEELILDESDLHVSQLLQSIASFTSLKYLSMGGCILTGAVHGQDFRKFNNLEHLYMGDVQVDVNTSFIQIVGESTPSLRVLDVSYNQLTENISPGLCELVLLRELHIDNNDLRENNTNLETLLLANNSLFGSFRMPIHSHQKLARLDVSKNFFQGHIPVEIGTYLPCLMDLNLSRNAFNSSIPSSFADMKMLKRLDISYNQLTGEIPERMATGCFSLEILALSNNSLQGHIFSKKFNLTNLMTLQLDGNNFTGEIPESLSKCRFLRGLYLSDNHLSGKIPRWLGNLSALEDIIMPNNNLEGPIPIEFCQLDYQRILDLSNNSIFGTLPSCFRPAYIEQVHLSKNKIEGRLESIIHDSPNLVTLDLSYNRLHRSIPNRIDRLPQLSYLLLANNYIEGEIPVQLFQLKEVRLIDLSHNNLSGHIPPCLVNTSLSEGHHEAVAPTSSSRDQAPALLPSEAPTGSPMGKEETVQFTTKNMPYYYQGRILTSMSGIDLSCNKLTGEIPTQIGYLTRIHALNLSHNNLTGTIPTTFSNLKQIESLDLSYNLLHGKIPSQLTVLNTLAVFSVAYNNFSGKIPDRVAQFLTFEEDSYEGNPFLCGWPLSKSCDDSGLSVVTPEAYTDNEEGDSLIDMDSFLITFTVSYGIVILAIIGVLYVNPYWRRRWFYLVEVWMTSCFYFVADNLVPRRFYGGWM
ncbi:Receptor-like protein 13 [Citrus sinensis]|nr:Receptor-like protein 13 [Citrus sinensis]